MRALRAGLSGRMGMVVEEKDLSSVTGNVGVEVLSTHCVVLLMELASKKAVELLLEPGEMVVGTGISIRHLSAVPKGFEVTAESRLLQVEGRRLHFDVAAYDRHGKIAEGRNELLVVSRERFLERLGRKQ